MNMSPVACFGASLTDDTRSVNYDCNTFIIQATGHLAEFSTLEGAAFLLCTCVAIKQNGLT